jgi:lipoyl-dependent peroxiredoxin
VSRACRDRQREQFDWRNRADPTVDATVRIGKRKDGGGFGLVVELKANLPGLSCEQADDLVRCADGVCPYSHAIHGNVQVTLSA